MVRSFYGQGTHQHVLSQIRQGARKVLREVALCQMCSVYILVLDEEVVSSQVKRQSVSGSVNNLASLTVTCVNAETVSLAALATSRNRDIVAALATPRNRDIVSGTFATVTREADASCSVKAYPPLLVSARNNSALVFLPVFCKL